MRLYYDLHIHSCLSPCGDNDMTPNNIVNMAAIKGLDVIAITDHNCAHNAAAAIEAAKELPLVVIPGMEVESSEEIHLVTLFPDIESVEKMQEIVLSKLPPIKNKPAIFGEQIIMDKNDKILGFKEQFLITACSMSIFELADTVRSLGGVIMPAHIDKSSYSVISNLGSIPDEAEFTSVEIKNKVYLDGENSILKSKYNIFHNSDAHYLWDISEKENYIECNSTDISEILGKISHKKA